MRFPRIQFSLFGLLAAMAVFGVALACIVKFGLSLPMVTIIWSLLLVILKVTPVLAFVGKSERRAFHAGFAWFGWMYILVCVFGTLADNPNLNTPSSVLGIPRLAIEKWMFVAYKWILPPESRTWQSDPESDYQALAMEYDSRVVTYGGFGTGGGMGPLLPMAVGGGGFGTAPTGPIRMIPWAVCRDMGHAALATIWALIGGCFALLIARRNVKKTQANATTAP